MAQFSTTHADFALPPAETTTTCTPLSCHDLEGPANRALWELALTLGMDDSSDAKWSAGKSLAFILASSSLLWVLAAAVYFTLR